MSPSRPLFSGRSHHSLMFWPSCCGLRRFSGNCCLFLLCPQVDYLPRPSSETFYPGASPINGIFGSRPLLIVSSFGQTPGLNQSLDECTRSSMITRSLI